MVHHFENIPRHVAVIIDGNGRWAATEGRERLYGHFNGVNSVRQMVKTARSIGVEYLTVYAFSTENWGRPADEVDGLMTLVAQTIMQEVEPLKEQGIRFRFIGDIDNLPQSVRDSIDKALAVEVNPVRMTLVIALNYSSRSEITQAVRNICRQGTPCEKITPELITANLQSGDMPEPDLLIRTSGEQRLSNFMLWQLSYAELYFTPVLWPEFGAEQFYKAIESYNKRDRRFGLIK